MTDEKALDIEISPTAEAAEQLAENSADQLTEDSAATDQLTENSAAATDGEGAIFESEPERGEPGGESPEDTLALELDALRADFPELAGVGSLSEIDGAIRYGELRELGLSPREAYLATRPRRTLQQSRAHLTSASPASRRAHAPAIPQRELRLARELFDGLSDTEIEALYKRVTR